MDEQMNQQNAAQTEIAQRAQMEIQMLNRTAEKKKMKASYSIFGDYVLKKI